jgi:hypothetical protein
MNAAEFVQRQLKFTKNGCKNISEQFRCVVKMCAIDIFERFLGWVSKQCVPVEAKKMK